jgi:hypothetical protein
VHFRLLYLARDRSDGMIPLKMRSFLDSTVPRIRKSLADEQSKLDVSKVSMTKRRAQVFVPP